MRRLLRTGWLPVAAALALVITACSASRVTMTARSSVEQQLLVRALGRAVERIDTSRLTGKRVTVDLFALTSDQAFAKELVSARLAQRGVELVKEPDKADLRLKIFASVLGVDQSETLLGVPAFILPFINAPIPEIPFFKWVRNRGQSEVEIVAYDSRRDIAVDGEPPATGQAKYDRYTVLVFISFTVSDIDEEVAPRGPAG